MSSPFRHFRKHSKVFMATAAVICMFIFVFADGFGNFSPSDGRAANATVATWNGGSINQRELSQLVQQRLIVDEFLQRLFNQGGGQSIYDLPTSVPPLLLNSRRTDQVEMEAIATEVLADLARDAGMTVSDAMINHYIEEFALKNVARDEMLGILGTVGQGNLGENESIVFSMLRKMLLAYFYRGSFGDASYVVMPRERWEDWRRVNERISVQAAVLPVSKFEKDLPEPTDAQLKALYEEFKNVEADRLVLVNGRELPWPDPGFAEPRRVRLAYLVGNVAERTDAMLDKVTEEEIVAYYEKNKPLEFVKDVFSIDEEPAGQADGATADADQSLNGSVDSPSETAVGEAPSDTTGQGGEKAGTPAADPPTGAGTPADDSPLEEESRGRAAASSSAAESGPVDEQAPAADAPDNVSTPSDSNDEPPSEESQDDGKSSSTRRRSPFRLAALQTSESDGLADTVESNAEDPLDARAGDAEQSDANDQPPSDESRSTETGAVDGAGSSDTEAAPENPEEYEPLEKVREEIRSTLAREKADEELQNIMSKAAAQVQLEYNSYRSAVIRAEEAKKQPPKPPVSLTDLKPLAEKLSLKAEGTELVTAQQLRDSAVGTAADVQSGRTSVLRAAFVTLNEFEPFLAREIEGDWYLVLKTEDKPQRVPPFEEAREKVIAAWKRQQAAELAEKASKELAAEVAKASQPFDQFFTEKGYEVVPQTELFSWQSYPTGPGTGTPPILSEVRELTNVGPEFMETAFELEEDETAGLLNYDKSFAYVIRIASRQYARDELKALFLEEANTWPGQIDMRMARQEQFTTMVQREVLERHAGLEFEEEWLKQRAEREQQQ